MRRKYLGVTFVEHLVLKGTTKIGCGHGIDSIHGEGNVRDSNYVKLEPRLKLRGIS